MIRLHKYIADSGITSRRKAENYIVQGRVRVNDERVLELGVKINPSKDIVMVDNNIIERDHVQKIYIILHKPRGYLTTVFDPEGRKTIMDLIQDCSERVYPVGRLDYLSEGLLLVTNDGELGNQVIHPSKKITKVYEVKVFGAINEAILKLLRKGVIVEGVLLRPKNVRVIKQLPGKTWLEFQLEEGKNKEIRKICNNVGIIIDKLKRIAIGGLVLEGIAPGSYQYITKKKLLDRIYSHSASDKRYWSSKKSINLKKKGHQDCTIANDRLFAKFKKETYFKTIQEIEERKARDKKMKEKDSLEQREEAHQRRQHKKQIRGKKKLSNRS